MKYSGGYTSDWKPSPFSKMACCRRKVQSAEAYGDFLATSPTRIWPG